MTEKPIASPRRRRNSHWPGCRCGRSVGRYRLGVHSTLVLTLPLCYFVARTRDTQEFEHQPVRDVATAALSHPVLRSVIFSPCQRCRLVSSPFLYLQGEQPGRECGRDCRRIHRRWHHRGDPWLGVRPLSDSIGRRAPYVWVSRCFALGLSGRRLRKRQAPLCCSICSARSALASWSPLRSRCFRKAKIAGWFKTSREFGSAGRKTHARPRSERRSTARSARHPAGIGTRGGGHESAAAGG